MRIKVFLALQFGNAKVSRSDKEISLIKAISKCNRELKEEGINLELFWNGFNLKSGKPIANQLLNQIEKSGIFIADLSELNKNVLFELGIAYSFEKLMNKEIIWLIHDSLNTNDLPSDIKGLYCLEYSKETLEYHLTSALCLNRSASNQNYENRVVTVLLKEMDGLGTRGDVLVIGTTNRPEAIDLAFKRPGRFTDQIELEYPNDNERLKIFEIHLKYIDHNLKDEDFKNLSKKTFGFSGAEIKSLIDKSGIMAIRNYVLHKLNKPFLTKEIILSTLKTFSNAKQI